MILWVCIGGLGVMYVRGLTMGGRRGWMGADTRGRRVLITSHALMWVFQI